MRGGRVLPGLVVLFEEEGAGVAGPACAEGLHGCYAGVGGGG